MRSGQPPRDRTEPDGTITVLADSFAGMKFNSPNDLTIDSRDRIYFSDILSYDGKLLDFVPVPKDEVTNCVFGGEDLRTLFITAGGTLWRIRL